ncbi:hypothetical protein ADIAL_2143 [Alkalibacterium sp. AK22]|uniref:hypothetical protein n=1 Tax=Alkalibacterium sp. AK22 TaxID=1229520 RepID=UPI00044BEA7B|nr:hypothetical protein [Alkalibacterium sp. AK22]EXJ22557.1 hypothetical protein ADIAL_2143 [Alkalibacterium sp. AK22]
MSPGVLPVVFVSDTQAIAESSGQLLGQTHVEISKSSQSIQNHLGKANARKLNIPGSQAEVLVYFTDTSGSIRVQLNHPSHTDRTADRQFDGQSNFDFSGYGEYGKGIYRVTVHAVKAAEAEENKTEQAAETEKEQQEEGKKEKTHDANPETDSNQEKNEEQSSSESGGEEYFF